MEVTGLSAPTVTVFISSSLNSFRSEKRYSRSLTIAEFKCKLELVVGSPASCMELELYGADEKFCSKLDQEDALLGSYPVDDGCRIHVIDHSGASLGEYEDVSKVEKYSISQEAYDQRQDSVRSFLKRSKLGRYNEEERAQQEAETNQRLTEEKAQASAILVGSRCEVRAPGQPPRRGTVMYVGFMMNGLQFPVNRLTVSSGPATPGSHLHLVRPVILTDLYKRYKYPVPRNVPAGAILVSALLLADVTINL
ncbi:tubulin-folding cofactor B isoform X1 [Myotis myotis]|uniref:tubulin-folding cofactor B isoform X1 n=1 Tax=Myotis myotis TaxID=51298 RepID=UPI00174DC606|nr:tubulin-folding cofactor B isoform X1 [Myotis myotis]